MPVYQGHSHISLKVELPVSQFYNFRLRHALSPTAFGLPSLSCALVAKSCTSNGRHMPKPLPLQRQASLVPLFNDISHHCASDLMKEYRKLDDSVSMRLNRNMAQFRDRERRSGSSGTQDEACAYFWNQLVGACATAVASILGT